jgi:hypothetical protein
MKANIVACGVAIDAEEDFDWDKPVFGTPCSTECMRHIRDVQVILSAYGIAASYLLTYPVLEDLEAVRILRRYVERGECDVGVQLHPWVTPPFDGDQRTEVSFSGNLKPELELRKMAALSAKFMERFGVPPRIYRAGRYGLSEHTACRLEELGFVIDTSLAPRTDFSAVGGPNYSDYGYEPFWFGENGTLLELPLCRDIVGWSGRAAPGLYKLANRPMMHGLRLSSLITRSRAAERITLSPEGNDVRAMIRLVRGLLRAGIRLLVLSFHSSSLTVGRNPYVRNRAELHHFYDRLSGVLDFIACQSNTQFLNLIDMPALLERPTP